MPEKVLKLLLTQSRAHNKTKAITGMLLFFDNKFIQLLEGDEKDVKLLYSVICADDRHHDVVILKEGPIEMRLFPEWHMSFRAVLEEEIANEPAYKDIYTPNSPGAFDLVSLFRLLRGKG